MRAEVAFSVTQLSSRETSRGSEADVALLDLALVCWYSKQWCFLSTLQERVVSWANPQLFYDYNRMEDSGPTMSWWWTRSWPGSPETWVFDFHLPEDIHANKYIWLLHISGIALQDHTLTCMQLLKGKKFTLQIFLAIQLGNCLVGIQFVCIT